MSSKSSLKLARPLAAAVPAHRRFLCAQKKFKTDSICRTDNISTGPLSQCHFFWGELSLPTTRFIFAPPQTFPLPQPHLASCCVMLQWPECQMQSQASCQESQTNALQTMCCLSGPTHSSSPWLVCLNSTWRSHQRTVSSTSPLRVLCAPCEGNGKRPARRHRRSAMLEQNACSADTFICYQWVWTDNWIVGSGLWKGSFPKSGGHPVGFREKLPLFF